MLRGCLVCVICSVAQAVFILLYPNIILWLLTHWTRAPIIYSHFMYIFENCLFICALWSPAGKVLPSWLSFVVSNCEFVTFPSVSWARCGTWLYRFLIFAPLLTLNLDIITSTSPTVDSIVFIWALHIDCSHIEDVHLRSRSKAE